MEGTIYRDVGRVKGPSRADKAPRDYQRQEAMVIPGLKGQKERPLMGT